MVYNAPFSAFTPGDSCVRAWQHCGRTLRVLEVITNAVSWFLHLDKHLTELIEHYGLFTYGILFVIIFCETGLVVTPFLPGDSLLFAVGMLAGIGSFNLPLLLILLTGAAVLGNIVNYTIGRFLSEKLVGGRLSWLIKQDYLDQTNAFFEKYGAETIIITRFMPILRTFAPFVAGAGSMSYGRFLTYNLAGGLLWVFSITLGGYFFGNVPIVKNNFSLVTLAIIVVSLIPAAVQFLRSFLGKKKETPAP